jgi:iron(III) transport system permease protein
VQTLTTAIYRTWYGLGNREGAAQIALVLIAIAGLLMLIERHSRGRARFHIASNLRHHGDPAELAFWPAVGAIAACALPIILGFVVPTIHLAQLAWRSGAVALDSHFLRDAANSLSLAAAAAAIIVVLALFLSYAGRLVRRRALNRLIEFSALGYAIPGAVIAVGILLPLALADHGIDRLSRAVAERTAAERHGVRAAACLHGALPRGRPRQHRTRSCRHRSGDGRQRARAGC